MVVRFLLAPSPFKYLYKYYIICSQAARRIHRIPVFIECKRETELEFSQREQRLFTCQQKHSAKTQTESKGILYDFPLWLKERQFRNCPFQAWNAIYTKTEQLRFKWTVLVAIQSFSVLQEFMRKAVFQDKKSEKYQSIAWRWGETNIVLVHWRNFRKQEQAQSCGIMPRDM